MIVLDASAVVELLFRTSPGRRIEERLLGAATPLAAPELLDIEVAQVLRRYSHLEDISPRRAQEALSDYRDLPIHHYPHGLLLTRVWELRFNLTAYDAVYVALAEELAATLLTLDSRIAGAPGHSADVEVVS